jgi:carboxylesterase type B
VGSFLVKDVLNTVSKYQRQELVLISLTCCPADGNHLIQQSMTLGKPFVFVTLNYRLGFYGFLSSQELEAEARRLGEEYRPNQGLYDQRLALEWASGNSSS